MKDFFKTFKIIFKLAPISCVFYVLFSVVAGLVVPALAYISQHFVDTVIGYINGTSQISSLIWACVFLVGVAVLPTFFRLLESFSRAWIWRGLYTKFDLELFNKKINIKYEELENQNTQLMLQKMQNPKEIISILFSSSCKMIKDVTGTVGAIAYLSLLNFWFIPALIAFFILNTFVQILRKKREIKLRWYGAESNRLRETIKSLTLSPDTQQETRTFASGDYLMNSYDKQAQIIAKERLKAEKINSIWQLVLYICTVAVTAYIMTTIIYGVVDHTYSIGVLSAASGTIAGFATQSLFIGNSFSILVYLKAEMKYYYDFMNLPNREIGTNPLPNNCEIVFKNVCFTYPNTNKQILNNINLTFSPNKNTAIVGENGSGKSTIVKLLAGLYKPTSGTITINGIDANSLTDEARFKLFGFVFQDINFYHITLRENIAIGDKNKLNDDDALKLALKNAGAYDLLNKVTGDLDAIIGWQNEQGITFSGGETQRLQISRAFLTPHKFVVLDEPVASLDAFAENKMYESFLSFFKNKGVIVISHRLASAKMADEIIVLENGSVMATGKHNELIKKNKLYKTMFNLQAKLYLDNKKEENDKNKSKK